MRRTHSWTGEEAWLSAFRSPPSLPPYLLSSLRLQETDNLLLTPFERNIEVWRQLWRVLERSRVARTFSLVEQSYRTHVISLQDDLIIPLLHLCLTTRLSVVQYYLFDDGNPPAAPFFFVPMPLSNQTSYAWIATTTSL